MIVKQYAHAAGLAGVTPRSLPHTFGKAALDAGVDLVTVARLMGHRRPGATAIYKQSSVEDLKRAVERLERG